VEAAVYREPRKDLTHYNILFDDGGIGDSIARLPAVEYITRFHTHIKTHLWVPDYFVEFSERCLSAGPIIKSFSEGKKKFNSKFLARAFTIHKINNLAMHMTDHAFLCLLNQQVPTKYRSYPKIKMDDVDISAFKLPEKYVVICTGFTTTVRQFLPQYINAVAKYIFSKGYIPVFLGKRESNNGANYVIRGNFADSIDFSTGIDLIDKTSLVESAKIVAGAKTIVGLDNGLLHIAGCTDVPIVGGFTTVNPNHRMPYRNGILGWNYYPVVPPETLACRLCQSNMSFDIEQDFTECFYNDRKCVSELSSDLYCYQLEKIL
jgi:ADP-heptose:LPS heptosyltransferase